jgi:hypothetical protein
MAAVLVWKRGMELSKPSFGAVLIPVKEKHPESSFFYIKWNKFRSYIAFKLLHLCYILRIGNKLNQTK